jgi:hypothetical protein
MPTRERLAGFIGTVVSGHFVGALRDYYHDDAITRENHGQERIGLPALITIETAVLKAFSLRTHEPATVLLDGDRVAIQWTFDITGRDGLVRRMEEMALQRWRGDRIEHEQFFYDPNLPITAAETER